MDRGCSSCRFRGHHTKLWTCRRRAIGWGHGTNGTRGLSRPAAPPAFASRLPASPKLRRTGRRAGVSRRVSAVSSPRQARGLRSSKGVERATGGGPGRRHERTGRPRWPRSHSLSCRRRCRGAPCCAGSAGPSRRRGARKRESRMMSPFLPHSPARQGSVYSCIRMGCHLTWGHWHLSLEFVRCRRCDRCRGSQPLAIIPLNA